MTDAKAADTPDPLDVEIGNRIRARRKWLGISQTGLADALGMSFQQVQKYENGSNRVSAATLVRIAARLQITVAALVGEIEGSETESALYGMLAATGAVELLTAFTSIDNPALRQAVLDLARQVSRA